MTNFTIYQCVLKVNIILYNQETRDHLCYFVFILELGLKKKLIKKIKGKNQGIYGI